MRTIWLNEDDAHFYSCHPAEDMTKAGLQRLVDYYASDTQVAGLLFCCSMQKALFASKTREPLYAGYDPAGGPDQPLFRQLAAKYREIIPGDHARNWIHNLWLLEEKRGINHLQVWLDRCRHHGIPGWLTMRMNDAHGLKEYVQRQSGDSDYDGWCLLCPSTFWKEHPELRRAPYRWERSWEAAYDYAQEAVRAHYLTFIREICGRFDMDGFELDWMRWGMNFKPGHEAAGRAILTAFVCEVRKLTDACAARVGHPVKLGVRVPAEPRVGWSLGYDTPAWVRQGLVDQVVIGSFGGCANFDVSVEEWRLLTDNRARLIVQAGGAYQPYPYFPGPLLGHDDLQRGVCANALGRGADGVYLFNDCYRESSDPAAFKGMLQTIGDLTTLSAAPRRHGPAFAGMNAAGDPIGAALPIPLTCPQHGYDFGRMEDNISVRLFTGPVPPRGTAVLHLGFSPDTPMLAADALTVRLNTMPLRPLAERAQSALEVNVIRWCKPMSGIGQMLRYEVPLAFLVADRNLVEFVPPKVPGELRWAEISFG
jgi:hypothetical protein